MAVRIQGGVPHLRAHLPPGIATLSTPADAADDGWVHVRIRAERLEWIPAVLAAVDRPFVVERPAALRDLVRALARRLDAYAAADDVPD